MKLPTEPTEIWMPVVGYEELYSVSDHGRIRRNAVTVWRIAGGKKPGNFVQYRERILKTRAHTFGYATLKLCKDGKPKQYYVHILVLTAFRGPRPDGMDGLHGDGRTSNNTLGNLRWGTVSDNIEDAFRHGTLRFGERSYNTKLSNDDAIRIKSAQGSHAQIAKQFGVNSRIVGRIRRGERWARVTQQSQEGVSTC